MKTKGEILNQLYMTAKDLHILIPQLGITQCRRIIDESIQEMRDKNYLVHKTKEKIALTKIVTKRLGI